MKHSVLRQYLEILDSTTNSVKTVISVRIIEKSSKTEKRLQDKRILYLKKVLQILNRDTTVFVLDEYQNMEIFGGEIFQV